jgi:hypothetical protein
MNRIPVSRGRLNLTTSRLFAFQSLFFFFQHSIDLLNQLQQASRVLLNCGLLAQLHPAFFDFPLHSAGPPIRKLGNRNRQHGAHGLHLLPNTCF